MQWETEMYVAFGRITKKLDIDTVVVPCNNATMKQYGLWEYITEGEYLSCYKACKQYENDCKHALAWLAIATNLKERKCNNDSTSCAL